MGLDGGEEGGGAVYGWVEEVAFVVGYGVSEGGGGVDDLGFGGGRDVSLCCFFFLFFPPFFLGYRGVGLERGGYKKTYTIDAFHGVVEAVWGGDVGDYSKGELVAVAGVGFADFIGRGFAADGAADEVALVEEFVEDVCCDEARGAGYEDCGGRVGTHDFFNF